MQNVAEDLSFHNILKYSECYNSTEQMGACEPLIKEGEDSTEISQSVTRHGITAGAPPDHAITQFRSGSPLRLACRGFHISLTATELDHWNLMPWIGRLISRLRSLGLQSVPPHMEPEPALRMELRDSHCFLPVCYISLQESYCWGSGQALTTTTYNIQRRKAGISLSDCPATITDAILVCIELGCQYLWVDALCIVQNLATDWEREANKMMSVYAESWLTIIAEAADTTERGFLHGRAMGLLEHKAPLDTRAWALQENVLAPRRLIYHHHSLSFECLSIRREFDAMSSCRHMVAESTSESYDAWERIVREYSSRHLTKETDIFPALSGLAEMNQLQRRSQDTYLAGLWKENLLPGLLWQPEEHPGPHRPTLQNYRAPSWSWASHNGRTSYFVNNEGWGETYVAEVICAQTTLKGTNQYGEVTGGVLKIRGFFKRGRVYRRESEADAQEQEDRLTPTGDDSWVFGEVVAWDLDRAAPLQDDQFMDILLDNPPCDLAVIMEPVFLLLIRTDGEVADEENGFCRGLLLKLSESGAAEVKYQRIGVFVGGHYTFFDPHPQTITIV